MLYPSCQAENREGRRFYLGLVGSGLILLSLLWVCGAAALSAEEPEEITPRQRAHLFWQLGYFLHLLGEFEKAIDIAVPVLERGLSLCQIVPFWFPRIASSLGAAYALSGRLSEALSLLEQAVERAASMRDSDTQSLRVAHLGEGYLLAGRIQDAAIVAGRALDLARELRQRGGEAWTLHLLGEIGAHREPLEVGKADEYYRQAITAAEKIGMRPHVARCHLGLGKLYRRTGKLEPARSELSAASNLFRAMDMAFWLTEAEAESAKMSG